MGIIDNKITAPVNVKEPYTLLGLGAYNGWYDVGYICSNKHERINPWSRYKPVCLPLMGVDDTFDNTTMLWAEKPQSISSWKRPWFYGTNFYPVFTIPVISSLNDLGQNGVPNEGAMWSYNPPFGGDQAPYRIDDFLGYNHFASTPMYVRMGQEIIINGMWDCTIEEWGTDKRNGEFEFKEVLKAINTTSEIYAGVAIRNITRNITVAYVKEQPLGDDYENGVFRLNPASGSLIKDGGFGHKVYDGDVIDIYLFLSTNPGETDVDSMLKYSPYVDKESECYMRYTVGHTTIVVTINYACRDLYSTIQTFASNKSYYVNDYDYGGDGNVFKTSSYIEAIYGSLIVDKTPNSDYTYFNIFLSGDSIGTKANGETFQTQAVPNITYLTKTNGNFNSNSFQYALNGTEGMKFIGYNSLRDAQSQVNGTEFIGCPIYDSIEDNYSDAENVGTLSSRKIKILCSAASSKPYYMLKTASKENNNIIVELS